MCALLPSTVPDEKAISFHFSLSLCRYQKTETALKSTAEKTTSFLGGIGTGITAKLGAVKNSDTFRSMEERVGSVYTNVKVAIIIFPSFYSIELTFGYSPRW